jgi:ubiquinone/menaquinone biosynthesis C-methylase UbiE
LIAVDGSTEMIGIAVRSTAQANIEYRVADLTKPLDLPDRQFDIVLANMVLMNMPRIDVAVAQFVRVMRREVSSSFR